jgi:hypothetical protein
LVSPVVWVGDVRRGNKWIRQWFHSTDLRDVAEFVGAVALYAAAGRGKSYVAYASKVARLPVVSYMLARRGARYFSVYTWMVAANIMVETGMGRWFSSRNKRRIVVDVDADSDVVKFAKAVLDSRLNGAFGAVVRCILFSGYGFDGDWHVNHDEEDGLGVGIRFKLGSVARCALRRAREMGVRGLNIIDVVDGLRVAGVVREVEPGVYMLDAGTVLRGVLDAVTEYILRRLGDGDGR